MKNIWLIRHCESESNSGVKTMHPATSCLTTRGKLQSEYIASSIIDRPDLIVHSPYVRTLQSAQASINRYPDVPIEVWPIQEFIYLPTEAYKNTTQAERKISVNRYWEECNPTKKMAEDSESFNDFIARMEAFIERLSHRKKHIVVFTHGHVIRAMIGGIIMGSLFKGADGMKKYRSLRNAIYIPNAAILKIQLNGIESEMSPLLTHHLTSETIT